jgi:hypothetical protein
MFNLRDYILKLLVESMGKEPDYKIRENALKWYEREILTEEDLEVIDTMLEERKKNFVDIPEETSSVEEILEENEEISEESEE